MKRVCSIAAIVCGIFGAIAGASATAIESNPEVLNIAVLGLGGRAQGLLLECMKLESEVHKEIRAIAESARLGASELSSWLVHHHDELEAVSQSIRRSHVGKICARSGSVAIFYASSGCQSNVLKDHNRNLA